MAIEIWLQLLVLCNCFFLLLIWTYYSFAVTYNSGPFLPSGSKTIRKALALAEITDKTNFVDIGSGDGRAVIIVAQMGAGSSTGIEVNPILAWFSRLNIFLRRVKNSQIIGGNMWKQDFSKYNLIYAYLLTDSMNKLLPILQKQCAPGTIIVANTFKLGDLKPVKQEGKIYLYEL